MGIETIQRGETRYVNPRHERDIAGVRVGTTLVCKSVDGEEIVAVRIDTNEQVRVSMGLWNSLPLERRTNDLDGLTVDDISFERAEEVVKALCKIFYNLEQENPFRLTDDLASARKFAALAIEKNKRDTAGDETSLWKLSDEEIDKHLVDVVQRFY